MLPISAVYGANASGKSSFVEAIAVLRELVLNFRSPDEPLPAKPHSLMEDAPTVFEVEFISSIERNGLIEDITFVYKIAFTRDRVMEESLYEVKASSEILVFEIMRDDRGITGTINIETSLGFEDQLDVVLDQNTVVLNFLNRKFKSAEIKSAIAWFERLIIIQPESAFINLAMLSVDEVFAEAMKHAITTADTGIQKLALKPFSFEQVNMSKDEREELLDQLRSSKETFLLIRDGEHYVFNFENGKINTRVFTAEHADTGGDFSLPLSEESDGTSRYFNLFPLLFMAKLNSGVKERGSVFVVDELDRSLHPNLVSSIVREFLNYVVSPEDRQQLIFTTHDATLLDEGLLRRDEVWFANKDKETTRFVRLSDFHSSGVRKGSERIRAFLQGQFTGVPRQ